MDVSTAQGYQPIEFFTGDQTNQTMPKPEQAIQYYRSSSVVLTLDNYNDTKTLNDTAVESDPHVPLPADVDTKLLTCVNRTLGLGMPLMTIPLFTQATKPLDDAVKAATGSATANAGANLGLAFLLIFFMQLFRRI